METSLDLEELNSPDNKEFVSYLGREIDDFLKRNGNSNTIMLFPPFNSYKRLLTHHLVESSYSNCGLSTFSIGNEPRRRTVVCLGSMRKGLLDDDANESKTLKTRQRSLNSSAENCRTPRSNPAADSCDGKVVERQRKVRKTINYYVPPHLRRSSVSEPVVKKEKKDSSEIVDENVDDSVLSRSSTEMEPKTADSKPEVGSKVELRYKSDVEEDWEPTLHGKGTCSYPNVLIPILDDSEMNDINKEVGRVRVVEIKGPSPKESSEVNEYVNSSMIEIYDLPEDIKTDDLAKVFEEYVNRGFRLRWVDETHALGIFSSSKTAEEALSSEFAGIKIRPIAEGTQLTQEIARNIVLPSSFRPKTCSSLAKRLLSGALGLKVSPLSPEERAAQREKLKDCKDQRKKTTA